MLKMTTLAVLLLLTAGFASAQTVTYDIPAGTTCIGRSTPDPGVAEGCAYHNMTVVQPTDGSALPAWATPFAWFSGGANYPQIDFQQFAGQNPAAWATYMPWPLPWQTATASNGDVVFSFDATTNQNSTGPLGAQLFAVHGEIQGHTVKVGPYFCGGGKGGSRTCIRYDWVVDSGFVDITPIPQ